MKATQIIATNGLQPHIVTVEKLNTYYIFIALEGEALAFYDKHKKSNFENLYPWQLVDHCINSFVPVVVTKNIVEYANDVELLRKNEHPRIKIVNKIV